MEAQLKPEDIYNEYVHETGVSVFGNTDRHTHYSDLVKGPQILKVFWEDNDVQQITITSTNIGLIKTFTKSYK